jgi:hypothetical protein
MKPAIIAPVFALALSGCAGLPTSITTAVTGINSTVTAVQNAAIKACEYQPTEATIEAIIGKFVPGLDTIQAIADNICKAVSTASTPAARRARTVPIVAGVPIRGRFVR